jgi:hypothetical protein
MLYYSVIIYNRFSFTSQVVCRESDSVALGFYDYCLSTHVEKGTTFTIIPRSHEADSKSPRGVETAEVLSRGIFFQPLLDTINISGWAIPLVITLSAVRPAELKTENIRSLAVMISVYNRIEDLFLGNKGLFGGLEELIIVAMADKDTDSEEVDQGGYREEDEGTA